MVTSEGTIYPRRCGAVQPRRRRAAAALLRRRREGRRMRRLRDAVVTCLRRRVGRGLPRSSPAELADFPSARRRELVQEISRLAEARAGLEPERKPRSATSRRMGVRATRGRARGAPVETVPAQRLRARSGALDVAALILLLMEGRHPRIGWLVGIVLLWISSAWTARQKLLGTLVVPGVLRFPRLLLVAGSESSCYQQPIPGARDHMICSSGGNWADRRVDRRRAPHRRLDRDDRLPRAAHEPKRGRRSR